ncbi:MAG: hypothetical protein C4316_04335 [Chloroflexota bacterium]
MGQLRQAIQQKYANIALDPGGKFHFHTSRAVLSRPGYPESLYAGLPEEVIASFAGTGNPFALGPINPGETVVEAGCGAGLDSLIASRSARGGG